MLELNQEAFDLCNGHYFVGIVLGFEFLIRISPFMIT